MGKITRATGIDENGNITYTTKDKHFSDERNKADATSASAELAWAQKLYELKYNSPEQVKQRLVEAGYNPNLYNNEGNTFGSAAEFDTQTADNDAASVGNILNQGLNGIMNIFGLANQRDIALKEQSLKKSELDLEKQKVDTMREDLDRKNRDTESQILQRAQQNKESEERIGVYRSQIRQIDANWTKVLQETENLKATKYNIEQQGKILEKDASWRDAIHSAAVEKMWSEIGVQGDQRNILQQQFIKFCLDNGETSLRLGADSFEGPDGKTYKADQAKPVILLKKQGDYLDVQIENADTQESRQWTETILNGLGKMVGAVATGAAAAWSFAKFAGTRAAGFFAPIVTPPGIDILMNQSVPYDPATSNPQLW